MERIYVSAINATSNTNNRNKYGLIQDRFNLFEINFMNNMNKLMEL